MERSEKETTLDSRFKTACDSILAIMKNTLGKQKDNATWIGKNYEWAGVGPKDVIAARIPLYSPYGDDELYFDREERVPADEIRDYAYQLEYKKGFSKFVVGFGAEVGGLLSFKKNHDITRFDLDTDKFHKERFDFVMSGTVLDEYQALIEDLEKLAEELTLLSAFENKEAEPVFHSTSAKIMAKLKRVLDRSAA